MDTEKDVLALLRRVEAGDMKPEDALLQLKLEPFEDIGFAKVDMHRGLRQGVPEVIYGASKTPEQIVGILEAMQKHGCKNVLVTRIPQETADVIAASFPVEYSALARLALQSLRSSGDRFDVHLRADDAVVGEPAVQPSTVAAPGGCKNLEIEG